MKKITILFYVLVIAIVFTAVPFSLFAAEEGAVYETTILPEMVEKVLELVILVLALGAAFYSVKLAALSQGGMMEKTWNNFAIASCLFALLEVNNALSGFGLVAIHGLGELIELVFVGLLVTIFAQTKKALLKQVLGK